MNRPAPSRASPTRGARPPAAEHPAAAALQWLAARPEQPPPELRTRLESALVHAPPVPAGAPGRLPQVVVALAEAAMERLRATLAAPDTRPAAFDLLAADALLTYALEAAAEAGPDAVMECVRRYGPDALARLLDEPPAAEAAEA